MIIGAHSIIYSRSPEAEAFAAEMNRRGVACGPVLNKGWGLLTQATLPGGGKLGIHQPRHARPQAIPADKGTRGPAGRSTRKPAKRRTGSTPRRRARGR